jgi:hypothetical protein
MYRLLVIACVLGSLRAEVIDRIAVTVDQQVITELQLDEELRVTAFLNHQPVARNLDARRAAASRLIQQLIVRREMELRHFPPPTPEEIGRFLDQVRNSLPVGEDLGVSLIRYELTEAILKEHLAMQLATLQFIEFRFRPELEISSSDIENYYQREILKWKAEHPGARPPTLAESKESIEKVLSGQRTDEALNTWLEERRKQVSVAYLDKSLE